MNNVLSYEQKEKQKSFERFFFNSLLSTTLGMDSHDRSILHWETSVIVYLGDIMADKRKVDYLRKTLIEEMRNEDNDRQIKGVNFANR